MVVSTDSHIKELLRSRKTVESVSGNNELEPGMVPEPLDNSLTARQQEVFSAKAFHL